MFCGDSDCILCSMSSLINVIISCDVLDAASGTHYVFSVLLDLCKSENYVPSCIYSAYQITIPRSEEEDEEEILMEMG